MPEATRLLNREQLPSDDPARRLCDEVWRRHRARAHVLYVAQQGRRRFSLGTHVWRRRIYVDALSYELDPGGAFLLRTARLSTVAADFAPSVLHGWEKVVAALRRYGHL